MAEALFQKLEEKMMVVLSEVENLRIVNQQLRQENSALKVERQQHEAEQLHQERKLETMISLLDAVCEVDKSAVAVNDANVSTVFAI
jgi:hypothetical protein